MENGGIQSPSNMKWMNIVTYFCARLHKLLPVTRIKKDSSGFLVGTFAWVKVQGWRGRQRTQRTTTSRYLIERLKSQCKHPSLHSKAASASCPWAPDKHPVQKTFTMDFLKTKPNPPILPSKCTAPSNKKIIRCREWRTKSSKEAEAFEVQKKWKWEFSY